MKKTSQPRAISSVLIPFGLKDFPCWWEIKTDISLPQNRFWVICGSKLVAKLIHTCVLRRKLHRPTENQRLAELPKERLEASAPFTNSSMDCSGPFIVKKACKKYKRYGLIFTCRAVHIEMLEDHVHSSTHWDAVSASEELSDNYTATKVLTLLAPEMSLRKHLNNATPSSWNCACLRSNVNFSSSPPLPAMQAVSGNGKLDLFEMC